MGLLDILNGMQNGPRGQSQPGKGGMSPLTMALLGLLAYKAYQKFNAPQPGAVPAGPGRTLPGNATAQMPAGDGGLGGLGGLGDLLKGGLGGLGGLLAGGAAGGVLSGGLKDLLKQFEDAGHGDAANSWVGTGANRAISPDSLEHAVGADVIDSLAQRTGMPRRDLLSGLSEQLPEVVNHLTPHGRIPTEDEMSRLV